MAVEPSANNQRKSAAKKGGRGGRRPGAGAPKGNLNALKSGLYSKQFALLGSLLAADPKLRRKLVALGERLDGKRLRANEIAALLLTRFVENERRRKEPGRPVLSDAQRSGAAVEGLNIDLPVDDWDSIRETAARLSGGKYGVDGDKPPAKKIRNRNNQRPNTTPENNQTPNTKRPPKTID